MMRKVNWPELLHEFIEARRERAFCWGENDCGLLAADWVKQCTGVDPAEELRGYADERGAMRAIKQHGGMRAFAASVLQEKPKGFAQRGDVVLADLEGRETFGIVIDGLSYCAPGADGLVFRPMSEAIAVFQV